MPTADNRKTVEEELTSARDRLEKINYAIDRILTNGTESDISGVHVKNGSIETYERMRLRWEKIIRQLEARLQGGSSSSIAIIESKGL